MDLTEEVSEEVREPEVRKKRVRRRKKKEQPKEEGAEEEETVIISCKEYLELSQMKTLMRDVNQKLAVVENLEQTVIVRVMIDLETTETVHHPVCLPDLTFHYYFGQGAC